MGLQLDFSADQAVFDNLEAVTFTSVRTAGNQTTPVPDAGFYPGATGEASPSNGVYTKGTATFSVRAAAVAGVGGAKPRDRVTRSNGDVYTVLSASPGNITQVWQLSCVCLKLAADLRQTGVLSRPANTQDGAGRPSRASYATVTDGIPCRVQPLGGQATDSLDKRTIPQRFAAYLGVALDARAGDRFTCDGANYTILAVGNPERMDELQTLSLEILLP